MRLGLVVLAIWLLGPASAVAFDCSRVASAVERRVCADATLRALDARLDDLLLRMRARSTPDEVERLKSGQRAWLVRRNACKDDGCLRRVYEVQTAALQQGLALRSAAETPLERCDRVAASRLEVDACLDRLLDAVERDLGVAHSRAERAAREIDGRAGKGEMLEALEQSDRAWHAFRDSECRRRTALHAATPADAARSCRIALAEWRMLDLLGQ